jgi:hypothetical protein
VIADDPAGNVYSVCGAFWSGRAVNLQQGNAVFIDTGKLQAESTPTGCRILLRRAGQVEQRRGDCCVVGSHRVGARPFGVRSPVGGDVVHLDARSASSSSTSRYDRPNLRYQRTTSTVTSGGTRNPWTPIGATLTAGRGGGRSCPRVPARAAALSPDATDPWQRTAIGQVVWQLVSVINLVVQLAASR